MLKEVNELKNADLKENTLKIINAQNSLKKNQWEIVNALGVILMEKQWSDDFESQNKFGEYLGVTTGTMSQYKNAYRFVQLTNADCDKLSVANAYLLSTFIKEEETVEGITSDFSEYLKFEKWCEEKEINFVSLSQKKLREKIKEYYKDKESADNSTADNSTADNSTADNSTSDNFIDDKGEVDKDAVFNYIRSYLVLLDNEQLKEVRKEVNKLLK